MKTEPNKSTFRLWMFVILAFVLLIAAWSSLIFVAAKFSPQQIPVRTSATR